MSVDGYGHSASHGALTGLDLDHHAAYPKGHVGYAAAGSNTMANSTTPVVVTSFTATVDVGRRYRMVGMAEVRVLLATSDPVYRIRKGDSVLSAVRGPALDGGEYDGTYMLAAEFNGDGFTGTFDLTVERAAGTGDVYALAGSKCWLEDIGPAP